MKASWFWPAFLAGLLALGVGINLVLLVVATGDPSFAVERDYYRKGVEWDRTLEQERANARLGWTLGCEVRKGALAVALRDHTGAPLPGAAVTVEAFHNARAGRIVTASLSDAGDGIYRAQVPVTRPGLWELRFRAVRGAHVFTRTVAGEVVP